MRRGWNGGDEGTAKIGVRWSYLCKRTGIKLVLGGDLQSDVAACSRVPGSLRTSLNLRVDLVIVTGREHAEVVRRSHGRSIATLAVSRSEGVARDGRLANVVSTFCADEETLVAERQVHGRGWALEQVGEQARVDVGLLVEQVHFAAVGALRGEIVGQNLGFEAFGQVVFQLDLEV